MVPDGDFHQILPRNLHLAPERISVEYHRPLKNIALLYCWICSFRPVYDIWYIYIYVIYIYMWYIYIYICDIYICDIWYIYMWYIYICDIYIYIYIYIYIWGIRDNSKSYPPSLGAPGFVHEPILGILGSEILNHTPTEPQNHTRTVSSFSGVTSKCSAPAHTWLVCPKISKIIPKMWILDTV